MPLRDDPALAIPHAELGRAAPQRPADQVLHFHVGLPKTATSLLQGMFYPRHDQIEYLGKIWPRQRFRTPGIGEFVTETLRQRVFQCDSQAARRLFDAEIRPLLGQGKAVMLSMEDGSHGTSRRRWAKFNNLRAACGECRLLITLRHPLQFVQSMYLQRVKKINTSAGRWLSRPWLPGFATWLDDSWRRGEKAELSHLFYADYIADWESVFGPGSVGVLVYEQLKTQPQEFFNQLTAWLGIQSIDAAGLAGQPTVNPGWTSEQLRKLRQVKASRLASLKFRLTPARRRSEMFTGTPGQRAKLTMPGEWESRIFEMTAAGNSNLADRFALPLAEFNYPL